MILDRDAALIFRTKGEDHTRFGLASKYQVNKDFTLQGKVDNKSQVSQKSKWRS